MMYKNIIIHHIERINFLVNILSLALPDRDCQLKFYCQLNDQGAKNEKIIVFNHSSDSFEHAFCASQVKAGVFILPHFSF